MLYGTEVAAVLRLINPKDPSVYLETYTLMGNKSLKFGRSKNMGNDHVITSLAGSHVQFYSISMDMNATPTVYVRDCCSHAKRGTKLNGTYIGKGDRLSTGRILQDGDEVTVSRTRCFIVQMMPWNLGQLSDTQTREAKIFADQYTITRTLLGSGAEATVYLAHDVKTKRQLACKVYNFEAMRQGGNYEGVARVKRSIRLGRQMQHQNISSFRCAYTSPTTAFVFEDLAAGGDLFSLAWRQQKFNDRDVVWIMWQLLKGLQYLRRNNIAHRDLKIENILCFDSIEPDHLIAITDFGHAKVITEDSSDSHIGTRGFRAPEQLTGSGKHNLAVDMWALGLIAVGLLAGTRKLYTMASQNLEDALRNGQDIDIGLMFYEITLHRNEWADRDRANGPYCGYNLTDEARDFIRRCLTIDPEERMTPSEGLVHPWMTTVNSREWINRCTEKNANRDAPEAVVRPKIWLPRVLDEREGRVKQQQQKQQEEEEEEEEEDHIHEEAPKQKRFIKIDLKRHREQQASKLPPESNESEDDEQRKSKRLKINMSTGVQSRLGQQA